MKSDTKNSESRNLRQKAEVLLKMRRSQPDSSHSTIETVKLIHELEVHQIELELQNRELILARSSVQELAERYTELYDLAPSGYFTLSRECEILNLNLCGSQMLGKERSQSINSRFDLVVSKDTKPIFYFFLERVFNNKGKETCGITLLTNGNLPIFVQLTGIVAEDGGQCLVTAVDISESKRAQETLQISEKRYKDLVENALVGIYATNLQGKFLFANNAMVKLLDYDSMDELLNADVISFYKNKDEREKFIEIINKSKQIFNYELELITRKSNTIDVLVNSFISEEVITGMMMDISGRKQAENEIRKLNETLERRIVERTNQLEIINRELSFQIKEIEQFTYIASHDLQEPLRTLTNFAHLIKEEYAGKLDEDGNKYIEFISNSAARMRALVTDILEYSLLGKEAVLTTVDCNKIVSEVLDDMAESIEASKANITFQKLPGLKGYETELRLLFQNLINNAIKFRGKEIQPEIRISAKNQPGEWLFVIEDNGIGIEAKDREKIFTIFKRTHNRSEFEGTGIGLAHCKKIVELHGGRIWVESTPGVGSTFLFIIPRR